jgi:hypothetical protein
MGLPAMGCNTLGKEDFILVPLPAAKTTTEKVIQFPLKVRCLLSIDATPLIFSYSTDLLIYCQ